MDEIISQTEAQVLLSEFLPEEEMQALLATGAVKEQRNISAGKRLRIYDFGRPEILSRPQLERMNIIFENFARDLTMYLSKVLNVGVATQVISIDQLSFEEFTRSMPEYTLMGITKKVELQENFYIELDPLIFEAYLDAFYGGEGKETNEFRYLTNNDISVAEKLFNIVINHFDNNMSKLLAGKSHLEKIETETQEIYKQSSNENYMVLLVTFELSINGVRSMANICIPENICNIFKDRILENRIIERKPFEGWCETGYDFLEELLVKEHNQLITIVLYSLPKRVRNKILNSMYYRDEKVNDISERLKNIPKHLKFVVDKEKLFLIEENLLVSMTSIQKEVQTLNELNEASEKSKKLKLNKKDMDKYKSVKSDSKLVVLGILNPETMEVTIFENSEYFYVMILEDDSAKFEGSVYHDEEYRFVGKLKKVEKENSIDLSNKILVILDTFKNSLENFDDKTFIELGTISDNKLKLVYKNKRVGKGVMRRFKDKKFYFQLNNNGGKNR